MNFLILVKDEELLLGDVVVGGLEHGPKRNKANDLRACHRKVQLGSVLLGLGYFEHFFHKTLVEIRVEGENKMLYILQIQLFITAADH